MSALRRAKKSEDETADGADDAGDHLAEMGAAGEDAGNQIKEAISGAVKAFVGFEAIKSGIELLKQFGAAAVSAFSDAESTSKKFGRSFPRKRPHGRITTLTQCIGVLPKSRVSWSPTRPCITS